MKNGWSFCFLLTFFIGAYAQPASNQWRWTAGSDISSQMPLYGTKGLSSAAGRPQGRTKAISWKDASGYLWLFGGLGYTSLQLSQVGQLNDLWKYVPSTGRWTWVSGDSTGNTPSVFGKRGSASPATKPGARESAVSWTDASGNLWLFGGSHYFSGKPIEYLNDLWTYDLTTNQWTWMGGDSTSYDPRTYGQKGTASASNWPGARISPVSWTDSAGILWMFGGSWFYPDLGAFQYFNDLWKFDPAIKQWTWVSGDSIPDQKAVYGVKGTPDVRNKPMPREDAMGWTDSSGDLWLFGGYVSAIGTFNDLWKFSPSSGQWTWISGDTLQSRPSIYGTKGQPDPANKPGGRSTAVSFSDNSGNLWLYGGNTLGTTGGSYLNEFWKYNISSGQWTWVSGDNTVNLPGSYGIKGIANPNNNPGGRGDAVSWTDTSGNFWLMGGDGFFRSGITKWDDLWKYDLHSSQWAWMTGEKETYIIPVFSTKGVASDTITPGSSRGFSPKWTDPDGSLWYYGEYSTAMWKYNPSSMQWTWMSGEANLPESYGSQGVASPSNSPAGRSDAVTWRDMSGNLWMFGGAAYGEKNDLWKYAPSSGLWTWISGTNSYNQTGIYGTKAVPATLNKPGARSHAVGWIDLSGDLWLFGGSGPSASYPQAPSVSFSDLWKYTVSTGQWTWMGGPKTTNQPAVYGIQGMADPANTPAAGTNGLTWTDKAGDCWLLGGDSYAELWKFNVSSGQWTWMNGKKGIDQLPVYGLKGIADPKNSPGTRSNGFGAGSWTDSAGNAWMFGGSIKINSTSFGEANDLWRYDFLSGQWTWIAGDKIFNQLGIYGTRGSADPGNKPGARSGGIMWGNNSGSLWIFGGSGYSANASDDLNDVWQYTYDLRSLPVQLSRFTASVQQQSVVLDWITMQEQNSRYFIIERSSDGRTYDSITLITAMGTSFSEHSYSFSDVSPLPGTSFYRLRQVDADGKATFSSIVKIDIATDKINFAIIQNPVINKLRLRVQLPAPQKLTIQVRDLNGHLLLSEIKSGNEGSTVYSFMVNHLAKGAYYVNVHTPGFNETKSFLK